MDGDTNNSAEMRQRAEWMVPADDPILEIIRAEGNSTPKFIEEQGGPSARHAVERCHVLARHGLLEKLSRGLYGLTDEGRAYLNEELDASELEERPIPYDEAEDDE